MNTKNFPFDIGITLLALALAAVAVPLLQPSGYELTVLSLIGMYAIALKGLDFVTGYTGEVSVGHAALFGLGAYAAGWTNLHLGLPLALALPLSIGAGALAAWLISFPLLRVNGPFLVLTTFAFGRIVYVFLSQASDVTGGQSGMELAPEAQTLFGHAMTSWNFYYLILASLALALLVAHWIVHSRTGRAFEALRDSPIATDCMGIGTAWHKQLAFVLSGAFGGLAGLLYVYSQGVLFPDSFGFEMSLMFLMAALFGGRKSTFGPILGAAFVVVFPDVLGNHTTFRIFAGLTLAAIAASAALRYRATGWPGLRSMLVPLAFALGMLALSVWVEDLNEHRLAIYGAIVLMVVSYLGNGVMGLLPKYVPAHKSVPSDGSTGIRRVLGAPSAALLDVRGVTMSFGGFNAMTDVSFSVASGTVMALIGPNGAGKSTTMNVLTALYQPSAGAVFFDGASLANAKTTKIAMLGISRTFQNLQVFGDLSVLDNVLAGMHHSIDKHANGRAMALLETVGLAAHAHQLARNLSYGQQRFLEVARALACNPMLLLLDEPAAGLRGADLAALKALILLIKEHGIAVVLIEHHMDVVMELSDSITVLNFGQVLARGSAAEIQANQAVQEAYLGA
ncbi:branched-chain amino acid ABC transporter ATP-binding protein/permease [Massilia glaciei]|uniref:ABC transporter n=1 Tax=Massilia glaciei TaxID=1524097 RepID=A0A2U2HLW2_9BURK|nr:branched-chain amino acid ABC transporter ATP-binding protein/permease [Massilia glaciei]PWF48459.1 ABC transporter [Massilia glaciei]